jgi:hypothetical protein
MQTFLPFADFFKSAKVLDYRRLGKQRIETKQIANILLGINPNSKWRNHPAVLMWKGHEYRLLNYGSTVCIEWRLRGYKDQQLEWFCSQLQNNIFNSQNYPKWFGYEKFHSAHRAALLKKKPEFYSRYGWLETPEIDYVWPTKHLV